MVGGLTAIVLVILLLMTWLLSAVRDGAERFVIAYATASAGGRVVLVIAATVGIGYLGYQWHQTSREVERRHGCRQGCDAAFRDDKDSYKWRSCLGGCAR